MSKVVHFEIPVDDPERATRFYRDVLAWEVSRFGDQPYWVVQAGGDDESGANGALVGRGGVHEHPVVVAGVEDVEAVVARVEQGGGRVLQGVAPIPGIGWAAYVSDPEGNVIGLFQADPGASTTA